MDGDCFQNRKLTSALQDGGINNEQDLHHIIERNSQTQYSEQSKSTSSYVNLSALKLESCQDDDNDLLDRGVVDTDIDLDNPSYVYGHSSDHGEPSHLPTEPDIFFDVTSGFDRYTNYQPVIVDTSLRCTTIRDFSHQVNKLGSQLNIPAWIHELEHENDSNLRNYLEYGVTNGFLIVDECNNIAPYERTNYSSVLQGEAFDCVNKIVLDELEQGKYVIPNEKPYCIHSLGAVPKKGTNKWRPITDCKRPLGNSINSFMDSTYREFCYTNVDRIIDMIQPGDYMASVDILNAYRSIMVHPSQWRYQGISWPIDGVPTYLLDTHICFGLRCAPYLFTQVSNFVLRCLHRRGFTRCAVYLDDFFLLGSTRDECQSAQNCLIEILRSLGFGISWGKCSSPTQNITYLGVSFDSVQMSVSIPPEKLSKLHTELEFFNNKKRATLRQIQRLCGILAHCSKVIRGGRTFSNRIIELLKGWPSKRKRIRLTEGFIFDLRWWQNFASTFNGKNLMIKFNYGQGPSFYSDACLAGYGFWVDYDWQAGYYGTEFCPNISHLVPDHNHWVNVHVEDDYSANINVLELIPIWLCLKRRAADWRNTHVVCHTDNNSVKYMINKGSSSNKICMVLIRDIFWMCADNNIYLTARHIPGTANVLADLLSRIIFTNDVSILAQFGLCCSTPEFEDSSRHGRN